MSDLESGPATDGPTTDEPATIRVVIPHHLRNLSGVQKELSLAVEKPVTQQSILNALEEEHPVLKGSVRDRATGKRRAFIRFFACEQDLSHEPVDAPVPDEVISGKEPFLIIGAMAGGE